MKTEIPIIPAGEPGGKNFNNLLVIGAIAILIIIIIKKYGKDKTED